MVPSAKIKRKISTFPFSNSSVNSIYLYISRLVEGRKGEILINLGPSTFESHNFSSNRFYFLRFGPHSPPFPSSDPLPVAVPGLPTPEKTSALFSNFSSSFASQKCYVDFFPLHWHSPTRFFAPQLLFFFFFFRFRRLATK